MEKRIKTTMIGAIYAIEKKFEQEILSDAEFKKKFLELRTEILDLGNLQIKLYKRDQEQ